MKGIDQRNCNNHKTTGDDDNPRLQLRNAQLSHDPRFESIDKKDQRCSEDNRYKVCKKEEETAACNRTVPCSYTKTCDAKRGDNSSSYGNTWNNHDVVLFCADGDCPCDTCKKGNHKVIEVWPRPRYNLIGHIMKG